jgi:hypothetical protein
MVVHLYYLVEGQWRLAILNTSARPNAVIITLEYGMRNPLRIHDCFVVV